SRCRCGANRCHSKAIATKEEGKDEDDHFDTRGNSGNVVCYVPRCRRATPSRAARCGRASNTAACATSGQCRERHYHADGREQWNHRNRRWIRGKTLFKQKREKGCMLVTSGSSVVQTEATGG